MFFIIIWREKSDWCYKRNVDETGYITYDSLDFFFSQKIDISVRSSIHLGKKNPVTHYDMHSPVTYDHMNKPFLLIVKPRSRRIVYNCPEAKILKNHDTFQINCILGVCLARLEIEFGKFFYFPLSILHLWFNTRLC